MLNDVDVSVSYDYDTNGLTAYRICSDKISKDRIDLPSKLMSKFMMFDRIKAARFITCCHDNTVIMTCKHCESDHVTMKWRNGNSKALLKGSACKVNKRLKRHVKLNSDEFMAILGFANGILIPQE